MCICGEVSADMGGNHAPGCVPYSKLMRTELDTSTDVSLPDVGRLEDMTREQMRECFLFIAEMRRMQTRWFALRDFDALKVAKEMEKQLDFFTENMLDTTRLF